MIDLKQKDKKNRTISRSFFLEHDTEQLLYILFREFLKEV